MRDDPTARERVVELARAGQLPPGDGFETLALPGDLAHVSEGGEIAVIEREGSLAFVFFQFRGLNHYTGWIYSEGPLNDDPLGNDPFDAHSLGDGWYEVSAG